MKALTLLLLFPLCIYSQVGINTTNPKATLDVEGNLRIAITDAGTDFSARDSILVIDGNQIIRLVSSKQLFSNVDKSLVKGYSNSGSSISIASGNRVIPFDFTEIDLKNEFNPSTHEFRATDPGYYRVTAQIKQATITVGDYGLSLYKVDTSNTESLLSRERYVNISVLGINLSSPMRRVETITFLDTGEKIRFRTNSAVSLTISAESSETFFTIEQIR